MANENETTGASRVTEHWFDRVSILATESQVETLDTLGASALIALVTHEVAIRELRTARLKCESTDNVECACDAKCIVMDKESKAVESARAKLVDAMIAVSPR